jgi:restriction endonuclease S subunit
MSVVALIRAMDSLKKREGDLAPTLKTIFFNSLKNKYKKLTIKEVLSSHKGGSWGNDYFKESIKARVLRSPDIRFGFIDIQNAEERYFTKKDFDKFSLINNDILVIKSNGSIDLVGKSQIYKEDLNYPFVIASNFLMVLTPNQNLIYPEYLDLFLKSPESLVWRFDTQKTTTGLRNLNSSAFLNIEIPVPDSIEEQRELFESFQSFLKGNIPETELEIKRFYSLSFQKENLSSELTHQLDLIKQLRQSFLREAMQGKLCHAELVSASQETGHKLLAKIKAEKAQLIAEKKLKKEKELPLITEDEIPFEIPEHWAWCRLSEICSIKGGKRVPNGYKLLKEPTPYIYIRVSDMKNGTISDNDLHYIDENVYQGIKQYTIGKDDIYMTIVGGTIGKCGLVPEKFDNMNLTENAAKITPILVDKKFLWKCLDSPFCQSQFIDKTKQVGVQKMALNRFSSSLIPLPPLHEQEQIVAKLEELMAFCDGLEQSIKESQGYNEMLLQQVLREALQG